MGLGTVRPNRQRGVHRRPAVLTLRPANRAFSHEWTALDGWTEPDATFATPVCIRQATFRGIGDVGV